VQVVIYRFRVGNYLFDKIIASQKVNVVNNFLRKKSLLSEMEGENDASRGIIFVGWRTEEVL